MTLEWITAERITLYCHVPPPGDNIPISVEPFQVYYLVPTEDKIELVFQRLINNLSGSNSSMRVEHLRGWLEEDRKAEAEAATETTGETEVGTAPGRETDTEA